MKKWFSLLLVLSLVVVLAACGTKKEEAAPSGANYPEKPVRIVAPSGAGGGWDTTARMASKVLGETGLVSVGLPVENIEGGSGRVFLEGYMKDNVGDPYTIFVNSPPLVMNALTGFKYSYKDVTPIAQLISEYATYAVAADSKYQTLEQVLEAIKADPSSVKVAGGSSPGSMDHLAFLIAAKQAGVDVTKITYVPFQGGGEALTALLGGNVDIVSTGLSETLGQVEAGAVKLLVVTGPKRLEGQLADVPTLKDAGIDASFEIWRGFFGAKDMPEDARKFWEAKFAEMVETPEWKQVLENQKWTSSYRNSEEFTQFLAEQTEQIEGLLQELGLINK